MNDVFARLPTLKNLARAVGGLAGLILACAGLCSCDSTRSESTQLETVLHTRPADHQLFASSQITNAIQAFGKDRAAAFAVLKAASNETNTFLVQDGRTIDTNRFVRAGALYGMGQLGKAVPEATPFLWGVIYSPSRNSLIRIASRKSRLCQADVMRFGIACRRLPEVVRRFEIRKVPRRSLARIPRRLGRFGAKPKLANWFLQSRVK